MATHPDFHEKAYEQYLHLVDCELWDEERASYEVMENWDLTEAQREMVIETYDRNRDNES